MARELATDTLDVMASYLASEFMRPDRRNSMLEGFWEGGPEFVLQEMYKFTFKDEFSYLVRMIRENLGPTSRAKFDKAADDRFKPRSDKLFHELLADKLAIDPDGEHIKGKVGSTVLHGMRVVGTKTIEVETEESILIRRGLRSLGLAPGPRQTYTREATDYWPIYAGEIEERIAGAGPDVVDPLPPGAKSPGIGALQTRISNEAAKLAVVAIATKLDEGSLGAVIFGQSGTQPADPDTAQTGTTLFVCTMNTTAFGAATDANPGGRITAAAITPDSSADATNTLGYCRCGSSSVSVTMLTAHLDGDASDTSDGDFNFNTLSIVAGGTVSISSFTVTMPEA